jgi:anaerobic ribonucleoside-triphosphate reductase activating protein
MRLRVHSRMESSEVNGPGRRAVIWLQGCSLHCRGCWNPGTHPGAAGSDWDVQLLGAWIESLCKAAGISGITISGGEPMEQAPGLTEFLESIRCEIPTLSIGLFSGYSEAELNRGGFRCFPDATTEGKRALWRRVVRTLDFAVLGRFNASLPSDDSMVTSKNQLLRMYGNRHSFADFEPQFVEVTVDDLGLTQITGFPVNGAVSS